MFELLIVTFSPNLTSEDTILFYILNKYFNMKYSYLDEINKIE